jgi:hypothetical protein
LSVAELRDAGAAAPRGCAHVSFCCKLHTPQHGCARWVPRTSLSLGGLVIVFLFSVRDEREFVFLA